MKTSLGEVVQNWRAAERRTTTTKVVRETEAEAVAFVIGKAVGLGNCPTL
jgi:hypothetical protein